MKKATYTVLFCFFNTLIGFGQNASVKEAAQNFNAYAYASAIASYEELVSKGFESDTIFKNLGDANYHNANYAEAAKWYAKLFDSKKEALGVAYYFRYAQSLKSTGAYKKSDELMRKFNEIKANDARALLFSSQTDYLEKIGTNEKKFTIQKLNINSKASDFAPSYYKEGLVFASARDTGMFVHSLHEWNNKPFLDLYQVEKEGNSYGEISKFSKELNTKTHESSSVFTKDGKTVYFTRNNSQKGNFSKDNSGLSRLKIYRAHLENGNWTHLEELPFNSDQYSTAHPSLSEDERTLYFASDMEPSYGASDIFKVDLYEDGSFGTPKNLGNAINTEARETFPFISSQGVLYFASDGHPGLGGLDMYSSELGTDTVINLGEPINSKEDDFALILNDSQQNGYFASNRKGGMGSDDIYSFVFEKLAPKVKEEPEELKEPEIVTSELQGMVIDKISRAPIPFAKVTVYDYAHNELIETTADDQGRFFTKIEFPNKKYRFVAEVEAYNDGIFYLITPEGEIDSTLATINFIISMERGQNSAVIGSDLNEILKLKSIYFNLNSSYLNPESYPELDKIVAYMKEHPEAKVEVGSHSDSRDSDAYNLWLSDRRAKSTVTYIVAMGISEDRISGKGYGETQLVNKCSNDVSCSDEQHARNRRSEFIVIKN